MEENKCMCNKCGCGTCTVENVMNGHKMCGTGYNHLIKFILKLFILMIIFCFGFRLGEISGMIHGSRSHMMKGGYEMMGQNKMMDKDVMIKMMSEKTNPDESVKTQ
jgi:hypothetical protein